MIVDNLQQSGYTGILSFNRRVIRLKLQCRQVFLANCPLATKTLEPNGLQILTFLQSYISRGYCFYYYFIYLLSLLTGKKKYVDVNTDNVISSQATFVTEALIGKYSNSFRICSRSHAHACLDTHTLCSSNLSRKDNYILCAHCDKIEQ